MSTQCLTRASSHFFNTAHSVFHPAAGDKPPWLGHWRVVAHCQQATPPSLTLAPALVARYQCAGRRLHRWLALRGLKAGGAAWVRHRSRLARVLSSSLLASRVISRPPSLTTSLPHDLPPSLMASFPHDLPPSLMASLPHDLPHDLPPPSLPRDLMTPPS